MGDKANVRSHQKDWAGIWLNRFRHFMALAELGPRNLNEDDVIRFLKHLKSAGKPAWQRLQALRSIMRFGSQQLHTDVQHLVPIEQRLDDYIRGKQIIVRDGKGNTDRATLLPQQTIESLQRAIKSRHVLHCKDLDEEQQPKDSHLAGGIWAS